MEISVKTLEKPSYNNLMKVAIDNSDALIKGSEELPQELEDYLNELQRNLF